jgi:glutathionylspermidine synthase
MRILIDDPRHVPGGRYRRFVRRAQAHGLLADHLYAGEPYLALNAVVLESSEADLLSGLSESFAGAFHKAGQALAGNVPALVEMGFPWAAAELLSAETLRMPLVGRFDFVQDESGNWWLLEFNADTPSGTREAIVADALVHDLVPKAGILCRPNEHLASVLANALSAAAGGMYPGQALGLVTNAGELEDLAQMAFTERLLAARGMPVVLGDMDNLQAVPAGLALRGRQLGAVYRYLPFESMFGTAAFSALYDAVTAGNVRLLNGLYGLLLQHKGLMAWLWTNRNSQDFTHTERAAIEDHLPPVWPVSGRPRGIPSSALVFKQVFGREGEEVFFGRDLDAEQLAVLEGRRTYVAQRRVEIAPLEAVLPSAGGPELRSGFATVGSYVVDGRWAGFYTRMGGPIVTARAKWLATFVEAGRKF